jgi:hypothetical protein
VPIGDISHSVLKRKRSPTEAVYFFRIVVLGLDLLLLLGDGLRPFGYRRRDNFLLRFLFREAQVGLRYVDEDRTLCLKRDGARKVEALLRLASELFRPTGHGDPIISRALKPTQ